MLYLNNSNILEIGTDWRALIERIKGAVKIIHAKNYSQPLKPYLRYNDLKNRIIAMPAYMGGEHQRAGIKWIASFPDNIKRGIPRAHAVIILNEADTGRPLCALNSSLVSCIRTAAVTGLVIDEYLKVKGDAKDLRVGINGFGPIGSTHLQMAEALFGDRISGFLLHDLVTEKTDTVRERMGDRITVPGSWEAVYEHSDIFMTCTVSSERYINLPPRKGTLQLNVSLRDYVPEYRQYVDMMIVDDWEEVCRENTDIEVMHKEQGLLEKDTLSLSDLVCNHSFSGLAQDDVVMFNPMGMAVFDICIANYFYESALVKRIGSLLED